VFFQEGFEGEYILEEDEDFKEYKQTEVLEEEEAEDLE
jgi:hypothetical protein